MFPTLATGGPVTVHWFRRDLRLSDHAALAAAQAQRRPVLGLFVYDRAILDLLPHEDRRVVFLHRQVAALKNALQALGSDLIVVNGTVEAAWERLLATYPIAAVTTVRDYEPYATERDRCVAQRLAQQGIGFQQVKDQVIFDTEEVLTGSGKPYQVFSPYKRAWLARLTDADLTPWALDTHPEAWARFAEPAPYPTLAELGFAQVPDLAPPPTTTDALLAHYGQTRNFPGQAGTSRLGVHLRFGTLSLRELARRALSLSEAYLNELIWRDFYQMILHHFPHVVGQAFKPAYDAIPWRDDPEGLARWKAGATGYPIVDAGMRELNATGYQHNRVRMITASFLTKHLLIDWRLGEAYFAEKLLDFELASNNGGWQWAAGTGVDAAPYFRIFNPAEQTRKFDPQLRYIRQWVPEFESLAYPKPIVDHREARERALATYKGVLGP